MMVIRSLVIVSVQTLVPVAFSINTVMTKHTSESRVCTVACGASFAVVMRQGERVVGLASPTLAVGITGG